MSKKAESLGMKTLSVDWKDYPGTDLVMDVLDFNINLLPFVPDILWASPDCTTYSIAACSTHRKDTTEPRTKYAKQCDEVNLYVVLNLIPSLLVLNPDMVFFIENPRGMMRKMPWMQHLDRKTVTYCQYGDDRMKPTDIWTNSKTWRPRPMCKNGDPCHAPAPRGSRTGTQGLKSSFERSRIPDELCLEILDSLIL